MSEVKQFRLPDVGEGLTEADIVAWHVKPGDQVSVNQVIVEIETAKAVVELPCPYEGVVTGLLVDEGATVDVGSPIIAVDVAGDEAAGADQGSGADERAGAGEGAGAGGGAAPGVGGPPSGAAGGAGDGAGGADRGPGADGGAGADEGAGGDERGGADEGAGRPAAAAAEEPSGATVTVPPGGAESPLQAAF